MPRKIGEIVEEARQLPYGERAELVERLIGANAQNVDPQTGKAWADIAIHRLKEIEEDKAKLIPGEKVMARARKMLGRT